MNETVEARRPVTPTTGATRAVSGPAGRTAAAAEPREVEIRLYAKREEIYPRARIGDALGLFQKWRWALVWLTQLVFYGLPWLQWNGRQAVLFDLAERKFYIFSLVLWPQDIIYLTGLLIIAALSLFLFTAVGGRLWCGYACPQTVYTEIFMWIERRIEGDRVARMKLDKSPFGARKFALKFGKHFAWALVALWTGYTFVGFFTPIRPLGLELLTFSAGGWALFWTVFYGFATYGNAGWMREQVCKYMCPYARFQSAMFDKDTLIVTYDAERGEPRGAAGKSANRQERGLGDCVDCGLCVQVCPTGIDIRNGLQYECIGCAACIDACNYVMDKTGLPRGLVRYTTEHALTDHLGERGFWANVLRPRVLVYAGILGAIVLAVGVSLSLRVPLKVDIIPDRGTLAREAEDGRIENNYRLQVMNTSETAQRYVLTAEGLPGLDVTSRREFEVAAASTASVPLQLRVAPEAAPSGSTRVTVQIRSATDPSVHVSEKTVFLGPRH